MRWKDFLIGLLLGLMLLFLLGAKKYKAPAAQSSQNNTGRYALTIDKTAQGKDYWTIMDQQTGVAKVFRDGSVFRVSFPDEVVQEVK